MSTGIVLIPSPQHIYADHPESPDRFSGFGAWDLKPYGQKLVWLESTPADTDRVATIHSREMINEVEAACLQATAIIDYAPTFVTSSSAQDAFNAVGGTLACTQAVLKGQVHNAFAVIRPPGHHAEPQRPMGFCIFNNIAIAARYAIEQGLQQVMIVDFDAHHGNGTQAAFWQEQRVAYFSTHQENIYPGSGHLAEAAHARGRIVNLPLPAYSGDLVFKMITSEVIIPMVKKRQPEMLLISAGFDSHWQDPLTNLGLSTRGFYDLAHCLVDLADVYCHGKIVFVLEGGYHPMKVASGVDACLRAMSGEGPDEISDPSPYPESDISERVSQLRSLHNFE
jgi:acetoin utilization deacetylase AcuC-like enzyme